MSRSQAAHKPDRNKIQDEHGKNNQRKIEFRRHGYQACDRQAVVGVSALTGAQRAAGKNSSDKTAAFMMKSTPHLRTQQSSDTGAAHHKTSEQNLNLMVNKIFTP
jgi:hypothetical protein